MSATFVPELLIAEHHSSLASHLLRNAEKTKISLQTLQLVMKYGCTIVTLETKQQLSKWKIFSPPLPRQR
jgi:hypothetical protein